jgi:hypothetical protein
LEDHLRPYFLHVDDLIMPLTDDPSGLLMHSQILLARRPLLFPDITNDACSLNTWQKISEGVQKNSKLQAMEVLENRQVTKSSDWY